MSQHLLSGARLYSLIGDGMHDLPTFFIDKLERLLADNGMPHPAFGSVQQLRLVRVGEAAENASAAAGALHQASDDRSDGRQQALDVILEILHAVHKSQHDSGNDVLVGERLIEGLLVAARELVKHPAGPGSSLG